MDEWKLQADPDEKAYRAADFVRDEFLNAECECVPLGGGVGACCGTMLALLAVAGFAIRKG